MPRRLALTASVWERRVRERTRELAEDSRTYSGYTGLTQCAHNPAKLPVKKGLTQLWLTQDILEIGSTFLKKDFNPQPDLLPWQPNN